MVTVMQAKSFPESHPKIKVNACSPGHVKTAFNGFTGRRSVSEGAGVMVWLATLPDTPEESDTSPTGGLWRDHMAQVEGEGVGVFEKVPW